MALKAWLKTLEGLNEDHIGLYVAGEGGFKLDVTDSVTDDGVELGLIDPGKLKSTLTKVRGELKESTNKLKAFGDLDIDKAKGAMEFQSQYDGTTSDDYDSKLDILQKDYTTKLADAESRVEAEVLRGNSFRTEADFGSALVGAGDIFTENAQLFVKNQLEANGKYVDGKTVMHGPDGNPLPSSDLSSGGFMTPSEYIAKMSVDPQYGILFKANNPNGGANGNSNPLPGGGANHTQLSYSDFEKLSSAEQGAAYESNKPYYEKLLA